MSMSMATPPETGTPSLVAESLVETDTNTLILTQLSPAFFSTECLQALKDHFESYGSLHTWAPLKAFNRIVMVYWTVDDAIQARLECDEMVLVDEGGRTISTPLRVYRGTHTELRPDTTHLPVPASTHNFLISPPGSPPVGWEPVEESAPNTQTLASDLAAALRRLALNRNRPMRDGVQLLMTPDDEDEYASPSSPHPQHTAPGLTVFLEDADYDPSHSYADDTITPEQEGVWEGEMMSGGIGRVKATVHSMIIDSHSGTASPMIPGTGSGRIARVPTPRPPPPPSVP